MAPETGALCGAGSSALAITFLAPSGPAPGLLQVSPLTSLLLGTAGSSTAAAPLSTLTITRARNDSTGGLHGAGSGPHGAVLLFDSFTAPQGIPTPFAQTAVLWSPRSAALGAPSPTATAAANGTRGGLVQDEFGASLALSMQGVGGRTDTLAVGAPGDTPDTAYPHTSLQPPSASVSGAVHIFVRERYGWLRGGSVGGGSEEVGPPQFPQAPPPPPYTLPSDAATPWGAAGWVLLQTLRGSSVAKEQSGWAGGPGGRFGAACALAAEGDTLAIGAPGLHAVYIFKRQPHPGALFFLDQVLAGEDAVGEGGAPGTALGSAFGAAVAWGSNVLAVGAPGSGGGGGCAAVYHRGGWGTPRRGGLLLLRSVVCPPEAGMAGSALGSSLAVSASDNVVLVGGSGSAVGKTGSRSLPPFPSASSAAVYIHTLLPPPSTLSSQSTPLALTGAFTLSLASPRITAQDEVKAASQFTSLRGTPPPTFANSSITLPIPYNAPAQLLAQRLCASILPACTHRVQRFGPGAQGEYTWVVAFPPSHPIVPIYAHSSTLHLLPAGADVVGVGSGGINGAEQAAMNALRDPIARGYPVGAFSTARAPLRAARSALPVELRVELVAAAAATPMYASPPSPMQPTPPLRTQALVLAQVPSIPPHAAGVQLGLDAGMSLANVLALGPGVGGWAATAALAPHAAQDGDAFGWAVGVSPSGRWAAVGAPRRATPQPYTQAAPCVSGGVHAYPMGFLNLAWGGGAAANATFAALQEHAQDAAVLASALAPGQRGGGNGAEWAAEDPRGKLSNASSPAAAAWPYPLPPPAAQRLLATHALGPAHLEFLPLTLCSPTCAIPPSSPALLPPSGSSSAAAAALLPAYDTDPPSPLPPLVYARSVEGSYFGAEWQEDSRAPYSPNPASFLAFSAPATCGGGAVQHAGPPLHTPGCLL